MRTELSSSRLVVGLGSHAPSRCGGEDYPPAVTSPGLCSCSCSGSVSAVPPLAGPGSSQTDQVFLFSCGAGAGDAVDVEPSHDGVVAPWLLALAGAAVTSGS